jgi:hypothetical protein
MTASEMVFREETHSFEDLCYKCLVASRNGEEDTVEVETWDE